MLRSLLLHPRPQLSLGFAEPDEIGGVAGAKRAQRPDEIDGFEKVGLSMAVLPREDVESGSRAKNRWF